MHRAAEVDELPVRASRTHFLLEGQDLRIVDRCVVGAVEHQHRRADARGGLRLRPRRQSAVQADHTCHVGATARQLQHRRAAEAESERADLAHIQRCLARLRLERVDRALHARAQRTAVLATQAAGELACLAAVGGPVGLAVDVGHQHHVIVAGNGFGALQRVLGDAHPVGHHHQAGAQVVIFAVVDQPTAETVLAHFPFQRFGLHCGGGGGRVQRGCKQGGQETERCMGGLRAGNRQPSAVPRGRACGASGSDDVVLGTRLQAMPIPWIAVIAAGSNPARAAKWRPRSA